MKILRAGLWLLILFFGAEGISRVVFRMPEFPAFNRIRYMPLDRTEVAAQAVRSIRVVKESEPDGIFSVQTLNEYGFRGRLRVGKAGRTPRVVFVGDSFVEGAYVSDDETIPRAFEARAAERGTNVEAVNLGVAGSGFAWYPSLILDAIPLLRPDFVFLVLYANDLPAHPDPPIPRHFQRRSAMKPWLFSLLEMAFRREQLPFRWSWRKVRFDQPVPSPNNPWTSAEFRARYRTCVTQRIFDAMVEGRFHPLRIGGSRYLEEALLEPFDLRPALSALRKYLADHGARLLIVYLPERGMVTMELPRFGGQVRGFAFPG